MLSLMTSEAGLDRPISEPALYRPGLALTGYFDSFAHKRIQVIGNAEASYLAELSTEKLQSIFTQVCQQDVPCFIWTRDLEIPPELLKIAEEENIVIFSTPQKTLNLLNSATILLQGSFASSVSLHGCMVDIRGIGVLVMGKSGAGKSETAIGLLDRGASLVADDLVHVRKIGLSLITSAPELSQGYMEMRGIGIINVANIYGLSAIRPEKKLDLVVFLKPESDLNKVDRLGMQRKAYEVLGIDVPMVEIPVAAGRDTARLVTIAALDLQLRKLGYDMADEFNQRLLQKMALGSSEADSYE